MKNLTCQNILNLIPLFIEGKTDEEQTSLILAHFEDCEKCREKYLSLKEISEKIKAAFDEIDINQFDSDYIFFKENLSAYIDNELNKEDYLRFNSYVTTHPKAKRELEDMLYFIEQLQNIFYEQDFFQKDLSDKVINEIKEEEPDYYSNLFLKAAVITVLFILLTIFTGYFSVIEKFPDISDIKDKVFTALSLHNHSQAK